MTSDLASPAVSIEKLGQTISEAEALLKTIGGVPDDLIWQRPGERPSIAELFWLIHLADEYRFSPVADGISRNTMPRLGHINAPVLLGVDPVPDDQRDIDAVLEQVVRSRRSLVTRIRQLPQTAWTSGVVEIEGKTTSARDLVEGICTHDQEILREIGHRLLESDMG